MHNQNKSNPSITYKHSCDSKNKINNSNTNMTNGNLQISAKVLNSLLNHVIQRIEATPKDSCRQLEFEFRLGRVCHNAHHLRYRPHPRLRSLSIIVVPTSPSSSTTTQQQRGSAVNPKSSTDVRGFNKTTKNNHNFFNPSSVIKSQIATLVRTSLLPADAQLANSLIYVGTFHTTSITTNSSSKNKSYRLTIQSDSKSSRKNSDVGDVVLSLNKLSISNNDVDPLINDDNTINNNGGFLESIYKTKFEKLLLCCPISLYDISFSIALETPVDLSLASVIETLVQSSSSSILDIKSNSKYCIRKRSRVLYKHKELGASLSFTQVKQTMKSRKDVDFLESFLSEKDASKVKKQLQNKGLLEEDIIQSTVTASAKNKEKKGDFFAETNNENIDSRYCEIEFEIDTARVIDFYEQNNIKLLSEYLKQCLEACLRLSQLLTTASSKNISDPGV